MTLESSAIGVRQVRASRILSVLGFVGLFAAVVCALVLMAELASVSPVAIFSTYLFWLVPWTTSYVVWFLEPKRPGRVTVEPSGAIRIGGPAARVMQPGELESAHAVVRADGPRVEIVLTKGDVISIAVPSLADADAAVAAFGFGPGGRRQRIDLAAPKRRFLHLAIGFIAYQATAFAAVPLMIVTMIVGATFGVPLMMAAVVLALPFVYRFFRRKMAAPRLEIGDDGVTLLIGDRPPRFLARTVVHGAQVVPGTGNIAMSTAEGPVMVNANALDESLSRAAVHALERRWTSTGTAAGPRVAAFGRAGRPLDAWRAELAAKISSAGYRGDGLSIEEADAVVRNACAPADARIGAALALAAAGQRVRIADAAAPVADRKLRVALEAVAEGREELAELEAATSAGR